MTKLLSPQDCKKSSVSENNKHHIFKSMKEKLSSSPEAEKEFGNINH